MKQLFLIIALSLQAFSADFDLVFRNTIFPHEGNYTNDARDSGNWTGGIVGKGQLLGTKYGIAASVYGAELQRQGKTIRELTIDEAAAFYKRDYWNRNHIGDLITQAIADEIMDQVVNVGPAGVNDILSKVFAWVSWSQHKAHSSCVQDQKNVKAIKGYVCITKLSPVLIVFINEFTKERNNRALFFFALQKYRVRYYLALADKHPSMKTYIAGWVERATD